MFYIMFEEHCSSIFCSRYKFSRYKYTPGEELKRQCLKPTVQHGGGSSIMVRGCVSDVGMDKVKRVKGKVDEEVYYCISRHQMSPL